MIQVADISRYQIHPDSTGRIDFGKMRRRFRGVIMRACVTAMDGTIGEDSRLRQYVDWLNDYNASIGPDEQLPLCGFYDALRLEKDIHRQRDFYLQVVKDLPKVRPIPDLEGKRPFDLTPDQAAERLDDWLIGVTAEVEIWPMIYSSAQWFDQFIAPGKWNVFDLWIARYPMLDTKWLPYIAGPWADGSYKPRDWSTWRLWQYGTPTIGLECGVESLELDASIFNGDENDFDLWSAGMQLNPVPVPETEWVEVTANRPNIRQGPGTNYSPIGLSWNKARVHYAGEQAGEDGHQWYQVKAWMRDDVARKV